MAENGAEPDRWANPVTYMSLQMLQQAIERVGKIDRAAVIKELQTGTFDTIVGKVKLKDNLLHRTVGRSGNGRAASIMASGRDNSRARAQPVFPKPAWKQ